MGEYRCIAPWHHHNGAAVGGCGQHRLGGQLPGGTRAVFYDRVVACGTKLLTDLARHHIHSPPGGITHEDFQGFALREGPAGREACDSAGSDVGQAVATIQHDDPFKEAAISIGCGHIRGQGHLRIKRSCAGLERASVSSGTIQG